MTCYGDSPRITVIECKCSNFEIMIFDIHEQRKEGWNSKIISKDIFLKINLKEAISFANINVWIDA